MGVQNKIVTVAKTATNNTKVAANIVVIIFFPVFTASVVSVSSFVKGHFDEICRISYHIMFTVSMSRFVEKMVTAEGVILPSLRAIPTRQPGRLTTLDYTSKQSHFCASTWQVDALAGLQLKRFC